MDSQTPPTGRFANRYTIERELGSGGTATVYLAQDTASSRSVALKVLRRELIESVAADRFLREFRLNAALRHPHITPILDSGQFDRDLYLVMPLMEGGSLRLLLEKERQLSVDAVVDVVRSIGSALQHAHERGLIHRDVKPENILFSGSHAFLSDFGIARGIERATGESTTSSGIIRGTPAYMSPEQASGEHHLDGRTDQYSFACVVYEMLAGLPPFHGPTQESTIALRFRHAPREISVYRPSVPRGLERVIEKAMSLAPADRYANMGEFAKAFEAAVTEPASSLAELRPSARLGRRGSFIAIAAASCVVLAFGIYGAAHSWFTGGGVLADTTQVVVLPVESGEAAGANGGTTFELFYTALRRWQDLHVVAIDRTIDALRRRPVGRLTLEDMRQLASSLGARRYVLVKPLRTPTSAAVFAEYRDVVDGQLHTSQLDLPADPTRISEMYAALADSVVLRGASDGGPPGTTGPRHLFATHAFIRAANARLEWDLARADSELTLAVSLDSSFSRAYMWQAQQKSWENEDSQRWIALAERSLTDTAALTPTERSMARALALMGRGRFPEACVVYRRLVQADSMNFVGWYGLGECNHKDEVVVPDSRSLSGWRFRSSMQQAVASYVRAFQLVPATYRGFRQLGYSRLQDLLLISGNRWSRGHSMVSPTQTFLGVPTIVDDTIMLVAQPEAAVTSQRVSNYMPTQVLTRLRSVFDAVVTGWASAFPRSPATKEAVSVSLEMRGDPAAIDTIEAAEQLTTHPGERIRLASKRLALQLKFSTSGPVRVLQQVLTLADSLLDKNPHPATPQIAGYLALATAMTGRCGQTAALLRQNAPANPLPEVSGDITAEISELEGFISTGCQPPDVRLRLDAIARVIASTLPPQRAEEGVYMQLNGIVRAVFPIESTWVARFVGRGARTLTAERQLSQGRPDSARALLREAARVRDGVLPGRTTADAVVPEARVWLVLGDTLAAIASLESALRDARQAIPLETDARYNAARMGFLIQAYALHAQLLANRDKARARQSGQVALTMWRHADGGLQPIVMRLRDIMK